VIYRFLAGYTFKQGKPQEKHISALYLQLKCRFKWGIEQAVVQLQGKALNLQDLRTIKMPFIILWYYPDLIERINKIFFKLPLSPVFSIHGLPL